MSKWNKAKLDGMLSRFYALFWILGLSLVVWSFFKIKQQIFHYDKAPIVTKKALSAN
nr:hypothetical protein [Mucilaginibacter sp. FT3.2]